MQTEYCNDQQKYLNLEVDSMISFNNF